MNGQNPRAVVVHRQTSVRRLMAVSLRLAGCEALEADSGEDALRLLQDVGGADLLITSAELPGMSGQELARRARTDLDGRGPGIVLTSAYRRPERGAEDRFLGEPFGIEQFLDAVQAFVPVERGPAGARTGQRSDGPSRE